MPNSIFDSLNSVPSSPSSSGSIFAGIQEAPAPNPDAFSIGGAISATASGVVNTIGNYAKNSVDDIANAGGDVYSYLKNYSAQHQTLPASVPTPLQNRAMKILGVNPSEHVTQNGKLYKTLGPTYSMTPEERETQRVATLQGIGLNPQGEQSRLQEMDSSKGSDFSGFDATAKLLNSTVPNMISGVANPRQAATKTLESVNNVAGALTIIDNKDKYSPAQVAQAQDIIDTAKKSHGVVNDAKALGDSFSKDPIGTAKQFLYGMIDPTLVIGAGSLGTATVGVKAAAAVDKAAQAAEASAKAAATVAKIKATSVNISDATKELFAQRAAKAASDAQDALQTADKFKKMQSRLNLAGHVGGTAAINAGISAEQQIHDQGFVSPNSLTFPAVTGAALGGIFAGLGGREKAPKIETPTINKPSDVPPTDTGGNPPSNDLTGYMKSAAGEPLPRMYPDGTGPGAPLSNKTPINTENHIGYVGGVDATTPLAKPGEAPRPEGVIHYSKEMPATADLPTKEGRTVTVPVKETVAYHESVEYPLMHLEGPVSPEQLSLIHQRMGPHDAMPTVVEDKLKSGEPLTYAEAHDIATRSENHHVEEQFGVAPDVYQDFFKPYIKKVAEANKTASPEEIPSTLDTKPYDNMGHTADVMKGQGTTPEELATKPQKNIIHNLAKKAGMDDATYRQFMKDQAGTDSSVNLSKTQAGKFIQALKKYGKANAVPAALLGTGAALGAYQSKDDSVSGMSKGAIGAMFFALMAKHPELVEKANEMKRAGISPADIQKQLGVFQGAEGAWRGEFSDRYMSMDIGKLSLGEGVPFTSVVDHSKFNSMFPELADKLKIKVEENTEQPGGYYNSKTHTIVLNDASLKLKMMKEGTIPIPDFLKKIVANLDDSMFPDQVIHHEMMHAVQHEQGLPNGANYDRLKTQLELVKEQLTQRHSMLLRVLDRAHKSGRTKMIEEITPQIAALQERLATELTPKAIEESAWERYFHTSGEHEARATVDRAKMTDQQRRDTPVEDTMGMPLHLQRVGAVFPKDPAASISRTSKEGEVAINRKQTESPEFKSWFGESKVTDPEGKPQILYHGTSKDTDFNSFKIGQRGVFLTKDPILASEYAKDNDSKGFTRDGQHLIPKNTHDRVLPVFLKAENPYVMQERDFDSLNVENYAKGQRDFFNNLRALGYDSVDGGKGLWIALKDPTQIKSAVGNSGKFDPHSKNMSGNIDPELLKKMGYAAAFGTVGATLGAMYGDKDHPLMSMAKGAGLAVIAGPLVRGFISHPFESSKAFGRMVKDSAKIVKGETVNNSISKWQASTARMEVVLARLNKAGSDLGLNTGERLRIGKVMDGDKTIQLTSKELQGYKLLRNFDDELGKLGLSHGVLKDLIDDHLSHIWKNDSALAAYVDKINKTVTAGMSPNSMFAKLRSIKSIEEGKANGLTPVTEDPFAILNLYAKSVLGAIRNKSLLSDLRRAKTVDGKSSILLPVGKAPSNFVTINHPQMRGLSVHPAIASELRQVFYSYEMGPVQSALSTLNMAMKRSTVSFSLFHLTSLVDSMMGGMPSFLHPFKTAGEITQSVLGKSDFHKALFNKADPDTQALFERFIDSGARPQIGKGSMADVDVGNGYYEGLSKIQGYLDKALPGLGKTAGLIAGISHIADKVIFENAMSGMKFALWMHDVSNMNAAYADLARRKPGTAIPKQAEIDKIASGHVNNLMGAQNWIQAADQATSKFGRSWLRALGSPLGRKISQYALFAPDWTTSTAMSFTKALGKGSEQFGTSLPSKIVEGIRGLKDPKTIADLHRMYQIRSAAIYALVAGTMNYAYSGHYLWENKDPFTIDLGNGQRLQWNKHWLEPYEFAAHPGKTLANKLGMIPKEIINQMGHTEYWDPGEVSPPMKESRIGHITKNFIPIPFQNLSNQTPSSIFWNLAGRNVRGQRRLSQEERKEAFISKRKQIQEDRKRQFESRQKRGEQ